MSVTFIAAPPSRLVTRPFVAVTAAVFVFFLYVGVLLLLPLMIHPVKKNSVVQVTVVHRR